MIAQHFDHLWKSRGTAHRLQPAGGRAIRVAQSLGQIRPHRAVPQLEIRALTIANDQRRDDLDRVLVFGFAQFGQTTRDLQLEDVPWEAGTPAFYTLFLGALIQHTRARRGCRELE